MVFNVHILLHVSKTVREFGPLSETSFFSYEFYKVVIANILTGTKGPTMEICFRQYMNFIFYYFNKANIGEEAQQFCRQTLKKIE